MRQRFHSALCVLAFFGAVFSGNLTGLLPDAVEAAQQERPRLFVLVVFDQMRGDYLSRWESHFAEGGFRRLCNEGTWFQNCHYPYAGTLTGAGHASLLSGANPSTHGIVANEWYVPALKTSVNCVSSLKHERVPRLLGVKSEGGKASPENLRADTFGDLLKKRTSDQGKIVSLSMKDRSAILPAGKKVDACYWFDATIGSFLTSTYYAEQLHPWVEKFNTERPADQYFGKDWARFRPDLDYGVLVGKDDVKGEGSGTKQGRTFPHAMKGGLDQPGADFYKAIYSSPYGNELLLELAKRAIDAEGLGTHQSPDLLTISFSSNDAVGHAWGPDSQEVFDVTLRSDAIMKELLAVLDAKVGRGKYLLALSADHGVCPIPEVAAAQGKDAGRISSEDLRKRANAFLETVLGNGLNEKPQWIEALSNNWFYLDQKQLDAAGVTSLQAATVLSDWLQKQPGIEAAYTYQQLEVPAAAQDLIGQRIRQSYFPERCGHVVMTLKPYWLLGDYTTGTTHGSPYGYDTHVPLLFYGCNVKSQRRPQRISPTTIAATFTNALGAESVEAWFSVFPDGIFEQTWSH